MQQGSISVLSSFAGSVLLHPTISSYEEDHDHDRRRGMGRVRKRGFEGHGGRGWVGGEEKEPCVIPKDRKEGIRIKRWASSPYSRLPSAWQAQLLLYRKKKQRKGSGCGTLHYTCLGRLWSPSLTLTPISNSRRFFN